MVELRLAGVGHTGDLRTWVLSLLSLLSLPYRHARHAHSAPFARHPAMSDSDQKHELSSSGAREDDAPAQEEIAQLGPSSKAMQDVDGDGDVGAGAGGISGESERQGSHPHGKEHERGQLAMAWAQFASLTRKNWIILARHWFVSDFIHIIHIGYMCGVQLRNVGVGASEGNWGGGGGMRTHTRREEELEMRSGELGVWDDPRSVRPSRVGCVRVSFASCSTSFGGQVRVQCKCGTRNGDILPAHLLKMPKRLPWCFPGQPHAMSDRPDSLLCLFGRSEKLSGHS